MRRNRPQKPDMTRPAPFGLTSLHLRKGMSSRSTGTFYPQSNGGTDKQHLDIKGLGRYEFTIRHLPPKNAKEKDQFEISVEFEPEPENTGSALKDRPNTGCARKTGMNARADDDGDFRQKEPFSPNRRRGHECATAQDNYNTPISHDSRASNRSYRPMTHSYRIPAPHLRRDYTHLSLHERLPSLLVPLFSGEGG